MRHVDQAFQWKYVKLYVGLSRVGHRSLVLVPIHLHHTFPSLPPPPNISSMDYDIW